MVLASAWADGRSEAVYGHVITKFSVMRRFTFLWRAFRALESSAIAFDNLFRYAVTEKRYSARFK